MEVSKNAKAAFSELARISGQRPKVSKFYDEAEGHSVMVAECENTPVEGMIGVSSLGLSDHEIGLADLRVELIGAFALQFEEAANVVATCAFNAIKDGWAVTPDSVHPNVIRMYHPSTTVPHALLTDPFLWENGPQTLDCDELKIAWLMMVPIAEAELAFAEIHGMLALTNRLAEEQVDIADLDRKSVI